MLIMDVSKFDTKVSYLQGIYFKQKSISIHFANMVAIRCTYLALRKVNQQIKLLILQKSFEKARF